MDKIHRHFERSSRVEKLISHLYAKLPEIESARAVILTQSFMETEALPMVLRRAKAFEAILDRIPIIIRDNELIVGSSTIAPRGCQTYPEFSYKWMEAEFSTVAQRAADPFTLSEQTKNELLSVNQYWNGRTVSDLAASYLSPEAARSIQHNIFTVGNYFYNGVGHINVQYDKVLRIGYEGIINEVKELRGVCRVSDADYAARTAFLDAVLISCEAVIRYARRYASEAEDMAARCADPVRKNELLQIAGNCRNVPAKGAASFYEACQSFWFVQQLVQLESSGHSISPGRFDQYMYPFYQNDIKSGKITPDTAQELLDCLWVKFNDLNKCRDWASADSFSGYGMFQNLIVGGQDGEGRDATNELSYLCIEATRRVFLPQPSLSVRVWNLSPHEFLLKAAELTRTGIGLPAFFNDEVIIPSLMNRGLTLEEARDYCIIGCVEPQKGGRSDGWHDAAFFNMCRPLELVFSNGYDKGTLVGVETGAVEDFTSIEQFIDAYIKQMRYQISLLVNANNAVDAAHAERGPMPWLSCMVEDCLTRGKTVQEGGAVYNFTGPQGFGVANVADSLYSIKKLVFDEKKFTLAQIKRALAMNYGKQDTGFVSDVVAEAVRLLGNASAPDVKTISDITKAVIAAVKPEPQEQKMFDRLLAEINALPKFGNDYEEVDALAREAAYAYTRPLTEYKNPRGGMFQAGLYPVSANVPLGRQTGATPDGRLAKSPVADGVSPSAGKDIHGPTAAANSVARLDHGIASNGTLFNQKFHPSALKGTKGLNNFVSLIRSFFDQKGSHVQFNVVDRETLLDAQKNPENYKHLIVRVAGYSALFTTLSKSLQDDIIKRTEQGV
jgi:formate C-acetyltransferase